MSSRLRAVTIGIVFGLLGTVGVAFYVNSVKAALVESGAKQRIYVAAADIPSGTVVSDAISRDLLVKQEVPKRYTADSAVASLDAYKDQVTIAPIGRGEQVTLAKFRRADQSEVAYKLAPDKVAIAVPVDEITGVGGRIEAGDHVVVLATFAPGPGGADISRVLLTGVEVLAVAGEARSGPASSSQKRTITLAVAPGEAEKLVFAEERGRVWIGLIPAKPGEAPPTGGQTMESVFR